MEDQSHTQEKQELMKMHLRNLHKPNLYSQKMRLKKNRYCRTILKKYKGIANQKASQDIKEQEQEIVGIMRQCGPNSMDESKSAPATGASGSEPPLYPACDQNMVQPLEAQCASEPEGTACHQELH